NPNDWATELAAITGENGSRLVIGTTASGLLIWDGEGWRQLTTADGLPADRVNDLALWGDRLYLATSAGPCILTGFELDCRMRQLDARLRQRTLAILPTDDHGSRSAAAARQDREPQRLWILGAEWMGSLEGNVLTVLAEGLDLRAFDYSILGDLAVDEAGGIYFGSPSGLYYLNPERERSRRVGPRHGLAAHGTTALLLDRESNLWIGSLRGLTKISSHRFLSYDQGQGLLENEVSAIAEIAPGRLIFGHEGGLTFLGPDRIETLSFPRDADPHPQLGLPALGSPAPDAPALGRQFAYRVLDIAIDRSGVVWLAAHDFGLAHLTAERTVEVESLPGRFFTVEVDPRGVLWAATQKQLYRRDGSRFVEVDCGFELDEIGFYRWLHAGGDGRFYLATRLGLLWREEDGWHLAHGPSEQASNVYNVLAENDGSVWAATGTGLYRLEGERLVKADLGGRSLDRPAYLLLRDLRGRLWIGTDDGVMLWDRRQLRHFTIRHGLAGRETNRGAGLVDHRGQVWIGTEQGASVYRQPYDRSPAVPPGVELRTLEAGGRTWPPAADFKLRHDQNQLLFHVGTIGFDDEEPVRLRYRLDGLDDDWRALTATPSSEIRYTHLAAGRYRLRVAAARGEGPWSSEATSGAITIARPFWRAIWFYAAAAAAIGLALAGVHNLRIRAISKHNRRLQAEIAERQRAETERGLLIDDLQTKNRELERFTYTVSHDLKTPLVTILGFLGLLRRDTTAGDDEKIDRDLDHIESAAKKMGRLLDDLLELSRLGRVSFERRPVSLAEIAREAIDMLAAVIAERGVEVTVADDLPVVEGEQVRLLEVMQNLVENAIKFLGDQPSPRIEIGVRRDGDGTEVIPVRDNGIGIEP
ncbi:MAG: histidine kinase dimerization/phospho-acceptor domain-containing protein, partial [Thermoanaerobaculia bacterium]